MNFGIHSSSFSFVVRQGLRRSLPWRTQFRWHRQSARARARLPPRTSSCSPPAFTAAADTFAVMRFVKSNVSRQSGVRKSSNARQFSSIIHA